MKRRSLAIGLAVLLFGSAGPLLGQDYGDSLRFKNLERLIGKWSANEQVRPSPTAEWESGTSEWEVQWFPGRYVAQTSGTMRLGDEENSWIQVWGYHPGKDTVVSWYSDSNGTLGSVTSSGWDGTTFVSHWTDVTPDGMTVVGRCTWDHSSDFVSVTATCEQFLDGIWWTFRKLEGRKSD